MTRQSQIDLFKENMKFSAGHFTIFSATERERLHGHNFQVSVSILGDVDDNGLMADYALFKRSIERQCKKWNEIFILPSQSPYLKLEKKGDQVLAHYDKEIIPFLAKDVLILPILNSSLEELSRQFCQEFQLEIKELIAKISQICVKISSGPGQFASWTWNKET